MFKDFLWGVSLSGFQFEMGGTEKSSIDPNTDWFIWVHDKHNITENIVSGDLPEDGPGYWTMFREDHELAQSLGMNCFRIGVEWSRIFPRSTEEVKVEYDVDDLELISRIALREEHLFELDRYANGEAIQRYREIISDLRRRGFKVIVNLNHFTLPLWIHDPIRARDTGLEEGPLGWLREKTIVEFVKYSAYIAWKLGDLVDLWSVFNEPNVVAVAGYIFPSGFPPGVQRPDAYMRAIINMAVAHARAYDAIKAFDKVRADRESWEPALVGLIQSISPGYPLDPNNPRDISAAENFSYLYNEWFIDAVSKGEVDIDFNGEVDSEERIYHMYGRLDWIGVNYYSRQVLKGLAEPQIPFSPITNFEIVKGYGGECEPNSKSKDNRPTSDFGWEIFPEGLYDAIRVVAKYGKPILVTENGIADRDDKLRPWFLVNHVAQVLKARDDFDVRGYLHWSLIDNYEWARGFSMRFGLVEVDFDTKKRVRRKSAYIFKEIAENDGITWRLEKEYMH